MDFAAPTNLKKSDGGGTQPLAGPTQKGLRLSVCLSVCLNGMNYYPEASFADMRAIRFALQAFSPHAQKLSKGWRVFFIEHLLCARPWTKHLARITSFYLHGDHLR